MSDHIKLKILLEMLSPRCSHYHHEFSNFGRCDLKPEHEDDPSKMLTQCDAKIGDCELEP